MPPLTELPGAPNFTDYLKRELGDIVIEGPEIEEKSADVKKVLFTVKSNGTVLGKYGLIILQGSGDPVVYTVDYEGFLPGREGTKVCYCIKETLSKPVFFVKNDSPLSFALDNLQNFTTYKRDDYLKEIPFP